MSTQKVFSVNKFLGINESADGMTELKLGEASVIDNFYITDEYNLKTRPGIARYPSVYNSDETVIFADVYFMGEDEYLYCIKQKKYGTKILLVYRNGVVEFSYDAQDIKKVFSHKGEIHFVSIEFRGSVTPDEGVSGGNPEDYAIVVNHLEKTTEGWMRYRENPYMPLVFSGCAPSGGGEQIEALNILCDQYRVQYIGDGESVEFILPDNTETVFSLKVGSKGYYSKDSVATIGAYHTDGNKFVFQKAPAKNEVVEFYCEINDEDLIKARERFYDMRYHEHFNGATDTRVFFYGDGTNRCYYTGEPAHGNGLYIPAGNELAVDFSDSPITGLVRHYSSLLAFKPDGVDQITYEPVTLVDGRVIAGFYLRPVSRAAGNAALGQTVLVDNNPRTFCHNSIYDWRFSSSYRDERAAKCISQKVQKTLAAVPRENEIIMCDDNENKTCYVFLNDNAGTILVNRYDLDVWTIYHSPLAANNGNGLVCKAFVFERKVCFVRGEYIYYFEPNVPYDVNEDASKANGVPFSATWESGYMSFGAAYKQKYSSNIWVSVLPEYGSKVELTAKTDRRDEYLVKCAGRPLFSFKTLDFSNMSFVLRSVPQIKRLKIKVKKFVYYKLLFKVTDGAKATVLGYDQQVRYSSNVK